MESLCINQLDDDGNIILYRLNDYLDGKLIERIPATPIFLNYDHKTTLEEGKIAIWEWSNGIWAKESESSKQLCEILRINTTKTDEKKSIIHNIRKKLKEGIKPKQFVDPRWNLFIIHDSNNDQGVLLESGMYTYQNGIVKIIETDDILQYCPVYRISEKELIKSNGALLLEKRREFILSTDLVMTNSSIAIKEAEEIALYFLNKYKNLVTKHSRKQKVELSKLIEQLLHSEPLKSHYPDCFDIEQFFKDEDVYSTLEDRIIGNDSEVDLIDSFLKSNKKFTKSCEERIYKGVIEKHKREISKLEKNLKSIQDELTIAHNNLDLAKEQSSTIKAAKDALDNDIIHLEKRKTEIKSEVDSLSEIYNNKKMYYDAELGSYQQTILDLKKPLEEEINALKTEISTLKASKEILESEKQEFLKIFGSSTLNKSILPILIREIANYGNQQTSIIIEELKKPSNPVVTPTVTSRLTESLEGNHLITPAEKIPSAKNCDIDNLEDSLEDNLKDCGMSSKMAGELASYLQAAIFSKRSIIVCGDRSDCISNTISASILGKKCTQIIYTGTNPLEILNIVNQFEEPIIAVDGILNTLDYNAYFTLIKYSKKMLIFSCNDLKMMQAAPMEVWSSSILVDLTHDCPPRGTPAHPTIINMGTISEPKPTHSNVIKSTLSANKINQKTIIAGITDFLLRLSEYDSNLSTIYLQLFLKFLSKVSELNDDE